MKKKESDYDEKNIKVVSLWSQKMVDDYEENKTYQNNGLRSSEKYKGSFASEQPEFDFEDISITEKETEKTRKEIERLIEQRELSKQQERAYKAEIMMETTQNFGKFFDFMTQNPQVVYGTIEIAGKVKNKIDNFRDAVKRKITNTKRKREGMLQDKHSGNDMETSNTVCEEETIELTEEQAKAILIETISSYVKYKRGAEILSKTTINGEKILNISAEDILAQIEEYTKTYPHFIDDVTMTSIVAILNFNNDMEENERFLTVLKQSQG